MESQSQERIMTYWYMLSLVGKDRPGLVARLSAELCKNRCNLGDSSMARLGDNFSMMVMVEFAGSKEELEQNIRPVCDSLGMHPHLVPVEGETHHTIEPDVRVSLYAQDRMGIVEDVTTALAEAGLNILHFDSNVEEEGEVPTYYIHLEGTLSKGTDPVYKALDTLRTEKNIKSHLIPVHSQAT